MAFRHSSGEHIGKWEIHGRIVGGDGCKAWLVDVEGKRAWLPKRFCRIVDLKGDMKALLIDDWVAREKGFV